MLKKAKRENPLPVTSFYEDSFELHKRQNQKKRQKAARLLGKPNIPHRVLVLAIRLLITALAVLIAFWLYTLVDDFITFNF